MGAVVLLLLVLWILWSRLASPTDVALLNFSASQTANIGLANTNRRVRYTEVPVEKVASLKRYDLVLNFAMGLKITAEQRARLQETADRGTPVLSFAVTNPDNNICNLDSVHRKRVLDYLNNGNKKNYRSLANYIRNEIDGKKLFLQPADDPVESAENVFYDLDEEVAIDSLTQYEAYLKEQGFYTEGGPKVALLSSLDAAYSGNRANIDSMIVSFRRAGFNVYPIASFSKRLQFLRAVDPDAVIYFAHGRLESGRGDVAVEWLKKQNIPIFSPLNMMTTQQKWEGDPMGMYGGFLSQSIVMPELDGAVYPYVLTVQEQNRDGLYLHKAVPERLDNFTRILSRFFELKKKPNADKKIALFFLKGLGESTTIASGAESSSSIYNLLKRLKTEGYRVDHLPDNAAAFNERIMSQCALFNTYAKGAFDAFLQNGNPLLIRKSEYEEWARRSMPEALYRQVTERYGEAPGTYMNVTRDGEEYIAVARLQFGNVVLLPQPMPALGDDSFAIVHGADAPPPHTYIAPYLWVRHGFGADALIHFGTHGSLEFTPKKQVALSRFDWPEVLTGALPHFYYYTIGNVGEAMMAKRRSYATLLSYLTPPFTESKTRGQYKELTDAIHHYYEHADSDASKEKYAMKIKRITVEMGIHRDLRLDTLLAIPYSEEEIERIENFAEEIANEKIITDNYVTGVPYTDDKMVSTVVAMSSDPIAYSMAALDRMHGKVTEKQLENKVFFTHHYLEPAKKEVKSLLGGRKVDSLYLSRFAGVAPADISRAKEVLKPAPTGMAAMMMRRSGSDSVKIFTEEEKNHARAVIDIVQTLTNVATYREALSESPEREMQAFLNAFSGGYIAPSSGGDAVANPQAVPTGRNLYAINAEATPSKEAWEKGKQLANATLESYRRQHDGVWPQKICYTFWSSEFIETEGASVAQVFYLLGVEPVWDAFGRVADLRLIPAAELQRPRIDVVVQTSGQFRDLAASRLALIARAVRMAAKADEGAAENYVNGSTVEIERQLVDAGVSPAAARELATRRVFGGINGMYGTAIQEMITSGDRWEDEREIAEVYLNNMGASYDDPKSWGDFEAHLLRSVLHHTDAIVHPRQSNTWGALSLDHVYEFMGGMNLTIRQVTGKDPDAYFADYRNRHHVHMQELKEAIGVEARSTVFNPEFVREIVKDGRSAASRIEEIVTNTYGWNVTKPDVVDNEMWDTFYDIYVTDRFNLQVPEIFERDNPASMQEITAIMLETARKGMWKATEEQLNLLSEKHTQLVNNYGASGKKFSGSNKKLQQYIADRVDEKTADQYRQSLKKMTEPASSVAESEKEGVVLKKEQLLQPEGKNPLINGALVAAVIVVLFIVLLVFVRKRRNRGVSRNS